MLPITAATLQALKYPLLQQHSPVKQAGQKVPVTVTATDAYGNTSECEATITVIDYYKPEVDLPG
jgi:hypothetical protein